MEVAPFVADLADLSAVRAAADTLAGRTLGGLVLNAGMTTLKDLRSADGFERIFAVNVMAHQLLIRRLAPQLASGARVVVVSSGVHDPDNRLARRAGIPVPRWVGTHQLARPDLAPKNAQLKDGRLRYSTSKLANVLQARGLQCSLREAGQDVDVFAIDPGLMVDTELARELPFPVKAIFRALGRALTPFVANMRLSTVSAEHIASLVDDPRWAGRGFAYLDGDHVRPPSPDAQRDDLRDALWSELDPLIGLGSPEPLGSSGGRDAVEANLRRVGP